jgi:hypothetical protein
VGVNIIRAAVVMCAAALVGCGSSELLEQTVDQMYPIDRDGSISVTNTDGSVQIYGTHKPGLHLQAIKKAYSAQRLKAIQINIDQQLNGITITTSFPPSKKWSLSDRSGTVDYILVLPSSCSVTRARLKNGEVVVAGMDTGDVNASIENGRIFVRNCFGNVQATASTGAISLGYDWWWKRKFKANVQIADGNLFAMIPSDGSFRLHAEAPNGKIGNDFAEKEQRTGEPVTKVDTVVGNAPEAAINLIANDGNIKVLEANP